MYTSWTELGDQTSSGNTWQRKVKDHIHIFKVQKAGAGAGIKLQENMPQIKYVHIWKS